MSEAVYVLGGGIAGLAAAWSLSQAGVDVRLIEKSSRVGGVIHSFRDSDFLFEEGPTTVPAKAETLRRLVVEAGLVDRVLPESALARRRYVWSRGRLHAVPNHPLGILKTPLLSLPGRLRLLREPFIGRGEVAGETLAAFATRRLGAEAVSALVDPMVAGVFAARPEELGVEAFARLKDWETHEGSLFRGAIKASKAARGTSSSSSVFSGRSLLSFPDGLAELPRALAKGLGDRVLCGTQVQSLRPVESGGRQTEESKGLRWRVRLTGESGESEERQCRAVILALPVSEVHRLLKTVSPAAAACFAAVPQTPLAVVSLGYERSSIGHPLDGFGLLCASDSPLPPNPTLPAQLRDRVSVLGVLFNSSIFEGRAPKGKVALTVMLGGTRDPLAISLSDEDLLAMAHHAVASLLQASQEPAVSRVKRWPEAIPRYVPGHQERIETARRHLESCPGVFLAGNFLEGVGLESAALSGFQAARQLQSRYPSWSNG